MTQKAISDSNIDRATGEVMEKAYETSQHQSFGDELKSQYTYVHRTLRDPKDPHAFQRLAPDTLSMLLTELTAYYESVGMWLADEKLRLSDLKLQREWKYNDLYLEQKQRKSETNETARVRAKMACHQDDLDINKATHSYEWVVAWKKALGRWIDTSRSQLSYEKSMTQFER